MRESPIKDSDLSLAEAIGTQDIPFEIAQALVLITVQYISFDDRLHEGQLLLHRNVADEVREIFNEILEQRFPIQQIVPIIAFDNDDEASMSVNNTSAFNYRTIYPITRLSNHARGLAIDINPLFNPCTASNGVIQPANGTYDPMRPGTIRAHDPIVASFTSRGWDWHGNHERKDWQHFDKAEAA